MATSLSHPLAIALLLFAAAAAASPELVQSVCRHTSNYTFCASTLAADPRTPSADSYALAFVAFEIAYKNASATRAAASALLRRAGADVSRRQSLERCGAEYDGAVAALEMAYNDLNSETFFELADLAGEASRRAGKCDAAFKGVKDRPLAGRNKALKALCEICVAVSKLFKGGF